MDEPVDRRHLNLYICAYATPLDEVGAYILHEFNLTVLISCFDPLSSFPLACAISMRNNVCFNSALAEYLAFI
jgi:hypothetical protein